MIIDSLAGIVDKYLNKNARRGSNLPKPKPVSLYKRAIDLTAIAICCLTLATTFKIYHKYFQEPRYTPTCPIWLEILFYQLGSFFLVFPLLGIIYKLITWSPGALRLARNSIIINTLSNLSFCIYMVHGAEIHTKMININKEYTLNFWEILGHFFGDLVYVLLFSFLMAILVELPCSSLWRAYADSNFLRKSKVEKKDRLKGIGGGFEYQVLS